MKEQTANHSKKVAIVILVYNGMKWIDSCIDSLLKSKYSNIDIIAVDNGSVDQSAAHIQSKYPQVTLIRNKKNYGYGKGNNIGAKEAFKRGADYIAFLNQDIVVDDDWLDDMVRLLNEDKEIGMVSPIQYDYKGEEIDANFSKFILGKTGYFEDKAKGRLKDLYYVDEVIGASIIVKRDVLMKAGLFDSTYFVYYDEYDLMRRIIYWGYKIGVATKSKVDHNHTLISGGKKPQKSIYLMKRNFIIFQLKDPNRTFSYNLKNVFFWIKWHRHFEDSGLSPMRVQLVRLVVMFMLPGIYRKYKSELKIGCYM